MCHLGLIMEITMTKFLVTAYFLQVNPGCTYVQKGLQECQNGAK